jgi:XRE family aerobic/anaerobic benzoate catabolism transcriptional regulator
LSSIGAATYRKECGTASSIVPTVLLRTAPVCTIVHDDLMTPRSSSLHSKDSLLAGVGSAVRAAREECGLSRRALSDRSGVSERFLAELESGSGNISVARLAEVARALGTSASALLASAEGAANELPSPAPRGPMVALVGLRGAGKSAVGRGLAEELSVPFVEQDHLVERAAGLSLSDIFSLHGEAYYRRLAREALARFLSETDAAVLATGGGLVTDRESYRLLQKRCLTVWLRAAPEDHWERVLQQGDTRPGEASADGKSELRALLAAREPLYAQADVTVDTSRLGLEGSIREVKRRLIRGGLAIRPRPE